MVPPVPATWRKRSAQNEVSLAITNFASQAEAAALELLSEHVNAKIDANKLNQELRVTSAPRLVEISILDAAPSLSIAQARRFIEEHTTSAVGISGPRGVGKTTIIQSLCQERPGYIGTYVSAPIAYGAEDLLKVLQGAVAKSVLRLYGLADETTNTGVPKVLFVRALFSVVTLVVGFLIILQGRSSYSPTSTDLMGGTIYFGEL
jgi:ATPase subunit of ABC transporter with duplicated ATPase domains